ncbi:hypothetical protein [Agromyces aerolatus]|uniref:hypothetical protein n=1 Tax=Agromyces sp. LY-1074 TaxID=3074080 RepID=UPI00285E9AE7|nr:MULTISPECIES: hypothetical protein [unclassified Agromyces]MDR5700026.1 hypothetical protein [Agromyces sp. LY-1074]MDR5706162.1 hypothetical protein [Agromyces sp. LY-1358]
MTLGAVLAAGLIATSLPISAAPAPEVAPPVDQPVTIAGEVIGGWGEFGPLRSKAFKGFSCPDGTPYLMDQDFHPGEWWNHLPNGIEIKSTHPARADLNFTDDGNGRVRGFIDGVVWNISGYENPIYIVMHCVA